MHRWKEKKVAYKMEKCQLKWHGIVVVHQQFIIECEMVSWPFWMIIERNTRFWLPTHPTVKSFSSVQSRSGTDWNWNGPTFCSRSFFSLPRSTILNWIIIAFRVDFYCRMKREYFLQHRQHKFILIALHDSFSQFSLIWPNWCGVFTDLIRPPFFFGLLIWSELISFARSIKCFLFN